MGKQNANGAVSLRAASEELGKQLIKLYKSKSFTRTGKDLADLLFNTGIEAGALISGISEVTDRRTKISTANKAILMLNQTMYIANIMQMADFYRPVQVKPIISYIEKLIEGLRELLHNVPDAQRRIVFKNPIDTVSSRLDPSARETTVEIASVAVAAEPQTALAVKEVTVAESLPQTVSSTKEQASSAPKEENYSASTKLPEPAAPKKLPKPAVDEEYEEYVAEGWEEET